jgi:hypothetical protein
MDRLNQEYICALRLAQGSDAALPHRIQTCGRV